MNFVMQKLEWDSSYATGLESLDNEHKMLFGYINDLRDSLIGRKGKDVVGRVLEGLLEYTNGHFFNEEILLFKLRYPDYDAHKAQHEKFLSEVRGYYVAFKSGDVDSKLMSAEITAVVTEWLQEHIMKVDKAYVPFLKSKGVI